MEELNLSPAVKTTLNVKNFKEGNTPPLAQSIGDWALRIGVAGAVIATLPAVLPAVVLATIPAATFVAIGGWATGIGVIGKAFTKLFGKVDRNNQPTLGEKETDLTP